MTDPPDFSSAAAGASRPGRESRPAFRTTVFWVFLAAVLGLALAGDSIGGRQDYFRADKVWLYLAIVTAGFLLSRGLAKAGSEAGLSAEDEASATILNQADSAHGPAGAALRSDPTPDRGPSAPAATGSAGADPPLARTPHPPSPAAAGTAQQDATRPPQSSARSRSTRAPDPFERIQIFAARLTTIIRRTLLVAAIFAALGIALIIWLITRLF